MGLAMEVGLTCQQVGIFLPLRPQGIAHDELIMHIEHGADSQEHEMRDPGADSLHGAPVTSYQHGKMVISLLPRE